MGSLSLISAICMLLVVVLFLLQSVILHRKNAELEQSISDLYTILGALIQQRNENSDDCKNNRSNTEEKA